MCAVDLYDRFHDPLLHPFHAVELFIQNSARFLRVNGFKIIVFPLNIHHNGKCTLRMSALLRGDFMGACDSKVSSGPEAYIIRQSLTRTGHKIRYALQAGELHAVTGFLLVLVLNLLCRCTACQ